MGLLLPPCLALLLFGWLRRRGNKGTDPRETALLVALLLGLFTAAGTELLSALHALTRTGVTLFWSAGGLAALALRLSVRGTQPTPASSPLTLLRDADWLARGMALIVALFVAVTGLVAFWAVPNNFDSMAYHLARVIHWRQDHSIAFFATSIPSQNEMPPWAEWTILHLTLLQGGPGLANLVQWSAYAGCIMAASVLARLLGGSPRAELLAAFFVATLPAAVLEATSTQNDLVMAFWLACAAWGCLLLTREPGDWRGSFIAGSAIGLGLLTKAVILFYAAPFGLWAAAVLLRRGFRPAAPRLALIGLLILGLNLGHVSRNFAISGHFLDAKDVQPGGSHIFANDIHTPGALFSNVLRNLSLHAVVLHRKSLAEHLVIRLHRLLGLDPADPRTTFGHFPYFINEGGEDGCPMPFHLLAILLAFGLVLGRSRREPPPLMGLVVALLASAFLFCLLLKWQPFHARLHVPLFVVSAPVVALAFQRPFFRFALAPVLLLFAWTTFPLVFKYGPRPALGRHSVFRASADEQQYATYPWLRRPYGDVISLLQAHHVRELGFISNSNQWEYPIAAYGAFHSLWRTDQVLVQNLYAPLETTRVPDALVCTRWGLAATLSLHGLTYRRIYAYTVSDLSGQNLVVDVYLPLPGVSRDPSLPGHPGPTP